MGCEPYAERDGLVHYLVVRLSVILTRRSRSLALSRRDWVTNDGDDPPYVLTWRYARLLRALDRLDQVLVRRFPGAAANQIRLVWGFEKPPAPPG